MEEPIGSMPHFFCVRRDLMKSKEFQVDWVVEEYPQGKVVGKDTG